jgi:hypothetical protein
MADNNTSGDKKEIATQNILKNTQNTNASETETKYLALRTIRGIYRVFTEIIGIATVIVPIFFI